MKVLFLTNVPSPYRVEFFNRLGRECELTVLYQKRGSSERDKKWKAAAGGHYRSVFMKGVSTGADQACCPEILRYLKDTSFDIRVICGIASPTEMLAISYCKIHHISYWLEGDGGFAKKGSGMKERIKSGLIRGAELYFSTGRPHDEYYLHYGAEEKRIMRYPFSSVLRSDVLPEPADKEEKGRIRKQLGIAEDKVVLAVGQFIHRKGFDILLRAAKGIDAGIYLIGGVPTQEYLDLERQLELTHVHYVAFMTKRELSAYYQAADVFVLPTREDIWGLVVNEAMAHGLPVITTNQCGAGLELVHDGTNGYLYDSEDADELHEKISVLFNDEEKLRDMQRASLDVISKYTIEDMVDAHMNIFNAHKNNG